MKILEWGHNTILQTLLKIWGSNAGTPPCATISGGCRYPNDRKGIGGLFSRLFNSLRSVRSNISLHIDKMTDTKPSADQIEDYELRKPIDQQDDIVQYPECLRGMSADEVHKLGKRTTLKMDLIVMPAMVIMYILNYLGKFSRVNVKIQKLSNVQTDRISLQPN